MTIASHRLRELPDVESGERDAPRGPGGPYRGADERSVRWVPPAAVSVAAGLSSAAAAWMVGGIIRGSLPELISMCGVAIGTGLTYLSFRLGRAGLQFVVLPVAAFVGAVLITPEATGGTADLPGLVTEAIRGGGLTQPPIPFNPGWRFILVVLFAVVGAAASSLAVTSGRSKLAVIVPLPLVLGGALLQPAGRELLSSMISSFLIIGALALAYGADLATEDTRDLARTFEARRLLRGGMLLIVVMAGVALLGRADFLFPETKRDRIIPPRRPPDVPLEKDRELFRATSDFKGPWRVGVLDTYDGEAWLLPPVDPARAGELQDGALRAEDVPANLRGGELKEISVRVVDMRGLFLPVPSGLAAVKGTGMTIQYDAQSGVPRLERRVPQGFEYTVRFAGLPQAAQLDQAPDPDPEVARVFADIGPPPSGVIDLLTKAPQRPFTRLQFLRDELYKTVVLSGGGGPVDITPSRVAEMLEPNTKATPFEIAAAEAMLARWAGVPARIGYGYFDGNPITSGLSFRPKHGRAWLEAYFEGYGWIPLVGTPPRAAPSLTEEQKLYDPQIQASNELALVVYIPVQQKSIKLLFEIIRYWILVCLPFVLGGIALMLGYPVMLKSARASRRHRWGAAHGPMGRSLVAYADLRDHCHDLNLGDVRDSPLEFVERFEPDEEHDELAWLVTRLFWGDLRRDVQEDDAKSAEKMVGSVKKRVLQSQSPLNRFFGAVSRASLRDPFNDQIPNLYPQFNLRRRLGALWTLARRPLRLLRLVRVPGATMLALLLLLLAAAGCVKQGGFDGASVPAAFPRQVIPEGFGDLRFTREPVAEEEYAKAGPEALVTEGMVYTIHDETEALGALQMALFRPELDAAGNEDVQAEVEEGLGGNFKTLWMGTIRMRLREFPEHDLYLWLPPERNAMVLFVMRKKFSRAEDVVLATVAGMRGIAPDRVLTGVP